MRKADEWPVRLDRDRITKDVSTEREISKKINIQRELAKSVSIVPLKKEIKTIAGCDVSMNLYGKELFAGIVVFTYPGLEIVEEVVAKTETDFPYISGFLSFRELPGLLKCAEKLSLKPDVFMVDGQGIAHPRGLGIASHLGVELDVPTIGVAKSVLFGRVEGDRLVNPKTGEVLGAALKTKPRANPIIVSPGHLITLRESVEIVEKTLRGYRIPEPTRCAHNLVNDFRKGIIKN